MCPPKIERAVRAIAAAAALGAMLAGCSDIYYDRRETVVLSGGNAVAANIAEETIDPWPAHSGNTNITINGQRMQAAIERYRTGKVTPAVDAQALTGASATAQNSTQIVIGNPTSSSGSTPSSGSSSPGGGPTQTTTVTTGQ